jgi:hypothetical protein
VKTNAHEEKVYHNRKRYSIFLVYGVKQQKSQSKWGSLNLSMQMALISFRILWRNYSSSEPSKGGFLKLKSGGGQQGFNEEDGVSKTKDPQVNNTKNQHVTKTHTYIYIGTNKNKLWIPKVKLTYFSNVASATCWIQYHQCSISFGLKNYPRSIDNWRIIIIVVINK